MTSTTDGAFMHSIAGDGAARGMRFSGRSRIPSGTIPADTPLVVALHGGTYTSLYFDVPGFSLLDVAASLEVPIIAIDRPAYGGSTQVDDSDSIILKNAEVLDELLSELWTTHGNGTSGIFVIGHSIGGAIATALAARHPSWPLLGIAVSGCLVRVPSESGGAWAALPDTYLVELPAEIKDFLMFGPEWTYGVMMPSASHVANTTVPKAELLDITSTWITNLHSTAAKVDVPVHSRQGAFDHLWVTDDAQMAEFASVFTGSPHVDARLVPEAGHCIDFHRVSRAFQLEQLAFALTCCVNAEAPSA
jgi:pimeloyl-ACP methyl ester carboxylesterase